MIYSQLLGAREHLRTIIFEVFEINMTMRINQHSDSVADPEIIAPAELGARRFGGIARLYGDSGLAKLQAAHVCVIGVGGVGSWAAEALARSAVGEITLIDLDLVAESNINRQLHALDSTIGRDKTDVLKDRIYEINPACKVHIVDDFLSRDNVAELLHNEFDYVIDCIDDFRIKAALINHCKRQKIALITTGGAGGQVDPTKIRRTDLSRTQHDVLLAKTRKLLRQDYRFPRNPKRSFGISCVYSDEQLIYPDGNGGLTASRPQNAESGSSNALNCAGGLGSITHVTASFGLVAAAHVLNSLVQS